MSPAGPAPTITTSYFSPFDVLGWVNLGESRGKGGAKEGSTRSSRELEENSVKTGMIRIQATMDN